MSADKARRIMRDYLVAAEANGRKMNDLEMHAVATLLLANEQTQ